MGIFVGSIALAWSKRSRYRGMCETGVDVKFASLDTSGDMKLAKDNVERSARAARFFMSTSTLASKFSLSVCQLSWDSENCQEVQTNSRGNPAPSQHRDLQQDIEIASPPPLCSHPLAR